MDKTEQPKKKHNRNVMIWGVIVVVLYVGVHVLVRTDGIHSMIVDRVSTETQQSVSIEHCSAMPGLDLKLSGIHFQGVDVKSLKVSFNLFSFFSKEVPLIRRLRIQGLEVHFERSQTEDRWDPAVLRDVGARLGRVLGLGSVSRGECHLVSSVSTGLLNERTLLQLDRGTLVWFDDLGQEAARILDADITVRSDAFTGRRVMQSLVRCGHIELADGGALHDFDLEAFCIEGSEWITVLHMADSQGRYDEFSSSTLWDDLNLHLRELAGMQ